MDIQDEVIGALTCWREARGGQPQPNAMQAIFNVLQNRAAKHGTSVYAEATKRLHFSSMTAPGDSQLILWPAENDPQWQQALALAISAAAGSLIDLTGGSTLYYAPQGQQWAKRFTIPGGRTVPFPDRWNEDAVTFVCEIGGQLFFIEA